MPRARPLRPVLAAFLAACVLVLGWAAHSPQLHDLLCTAEATTGKHPSNRRHADEDPGHEHAEPPPRDHSCAITLFAAGADAPPALALCLAVAPRAADAPTFTDPLLSRTPPGPHRACGPPAATRPRAA